MGPVMVSMGRPKMLKMEKPMVTSPMTIDSDRNTMVHTHSGKLNRPYLICSRPVHTKRQQKVMSGLSLSQLVSDLIFYTQSIIKSTDSKPIHQLIRV